MMGDEWFIDYCFLFTQPHNAQQLCTVIAELFCWLVDGLFDLRKMHYIQFNWNNWFCEVKDGKTFEMKQEFCLSFILSILHIPRVRSSSAIVLNYNLLIISKARKAVRDKILIINVYADLAQSKALISQPCYSSPFSDTCKSLGCSNRTRM